MINRLLGRLILKSPKSVLLLGPRQVGKSTLMDANAPNLTINLAYQAEYLAFSKNQSELEERIASSNPKVIFIDEIQRIPDLLNTIQAIIDKNKKKYKFLLTGSSARKLKRGAANLLPGRIFSYRLGPLSCAELNFNMDSEHALRVGCLPEPYLEKDIQFSEKLLKSYAGTYLQEEILAETMLRDIQGFSRFLNAAVESSGKFLDFSKLANSSKVSRSNTRRYFEILEDTLLCDRVNAFDLPAADLVKHSKFFMFDLGVANGCLENFSTLGERKGYLFEHLFFNQLKNTSYAMDQEIKINHFRTRGGLEVDFIIQSKSRIIAVELKTKEPHPSELKSIQNIQDYFKKPIEKYVACLKCQPRKINSIEILPWQEVIRRIFTEAS